MKVSAAGGEPSVLIKARRSFGESWLGSPSFLPDGRHFLYSVLTGPVGWRMWGRWMQEISRNPPNRWPPVLCLVVDIMCQHWAVDLGAFFLGSLITLVAQAFDASRMVLKGDPSTLAEGVERFTASANGVLAYIAGSPTPVQLTWFDRQGKVLGTVGEPGIYPSPAISPDGRTVAVPLNDAAGRADIWLYDLRGDRRTRFTLDGTANLFPVWSPDGSRIAFYSIRKGFPTVYQKPVNGVGQEVAFETALANPNRPLDWSLDGRYLIEESRGDTFSIRVLPVSPGQGTERKSVPWLNESFNVCSARLSPDGKWIAYDSDESGRDEIFVRTFPNPGGKWQVSTNGGTRPLWSRNGKELYYIALDGKLMAADVKGRPDESFDAGAAKALFAPHTTSDRTDTFDVTKDGRFLIPTMTQQATSPIIVVVNWQTK